jgi:hypothetical protein
MGESFGIKVDEKIIFKVGFQYYEHGKENPDESLFEFCLTSNPTANGTMHHKKALLRFKRRSFLT